MKEKLILRKNYIEGPTSYSVAANIKKSPKYFTCGEKHEIWHTYLSDNTVSKIIIGHRDLRHFQDGCR